MVRSPHPLPFTYQDGKVAIATMHGKETVVATAFKPFGLEIIRADINTDVLGTFSGEIERPGSMLETAIMKASLGMSATGLKLGLASEGAYGAHPVIPFIPGGTELMVFIDGPRNLVVHETLIADGVATGHATGASVEEVTPFLERIGFPATGLVVRPNEGKHGTPEIFKGIRSLPDLATAMAAGASCSADGKALVMVDMRAHQNPSRLAAIGRLATTLALRLQSTCPACGSPGFGMTGVEHGLPCGGCGQPTDLVLYEIHSCPSCRHTEQRPRKDNLQEASPGQCPHCNP